MHIKASSISDMEDLLSKNLHIQPRRPRSRSLGEIEIQQYPAYLPVALEQAQEHAARFNNISRSASRRLSSVSSHEALYSLEHEQKPVDADPQGTTTSMFNEAYEDTSTYAPFSYHLALTNHFNPSKLDRLQLTHNPIFIHGMLQLPCTLSALLGLPSSDLLYRLTPAILLDHTTYLDATTLLPSVVKSTFTSTYHHVNGLLYFPKTSLCREKLEKFFNPRDPQMAMRKVTTQIQDSHGKRHDIVAWAWVAGTAEGTEEWWTCEDFIAGRVIGLQNVQW